MCVHEYMHVCVYIYIYIHMHTQTSSVRQVAPPKHVLHTNR